ncbi:MAG: WG repeat-containing protein [Prolixibacteraceae bacterium]|nr:WG repeat-containing protein [Prolixibacteraceae bacterium]
MASVRDDKGAERNSWSPSKPNHYGYINKKGELVIDYQFDVASNFSEGLAPISKGGKWGFIGADGKIKINPQFEFVSNFSNGLAAFLQGELWGFINKKEK